MRPLPAGRFLLGYLLFVTAVITLAPFRFARPVQRCTSRGWWTRATWWPTCCSSFPWGFSTASPRTPPRRDGHWSTVGAALLASAALETLQLFLPGRFPSLVDVLVQYARRLARLVAPRAHRGASRRPARARPRARIAAHERRLSPGAPPLAGRLRGRARCAAARALAAPGAGGRPRAGGRLAPPAGRARRALASPAGRARRGLVRGRRRARIDPAAPPRPRRRGARGGGRLARGRPPRPARSRAPLRAAHAPPGLARAGGLSHPERALADALDAGVVARRLGRRRPCRHARHRAHAARAGVSGGLHPARLYGGGVARPARGAHGPSPGAPGRRVLRRHRRAGIAPRVPSRARRQRARPPASPARWASTAGCSTGCSSGWCARRRRTRAS